MSWVDLELSQWSYETGGTGGVGFGVVAVSGGVVYLKDPLGNVETFYFGGLGAGASVGFKIPKLPKVQVRGKGLAAAGSTTQLPSGGAIFRRSYFGVLDMDKKDIQGAVVFVEVGAGLLTGVSGDLMLFGMNPVMLAGALASATIYPALLSRAINTATGAMSFGGLNVGLQAGAGLAGLVGYMG